MVIQRFALNENGRDYIVGDIHGYFEALEIELNRIGFDKTRDRLFSVGDTCDRGPESEDCVFWQELPWFHAVRGNHEQMIIDACDGYYDKECFHYNGADWWVKLDTQEQKRYYGDAFERLPFVIELETTKGKIGIVHADCPSHDWITFCTRIEHEQDHMPGGRFLSTMKNCAIWMRERVIQKDCTPVTNIRAVVCGHTGVEKHTIFGNVHMIDTRYEGHHWTILDAETLERI